jgi:hypothetical protein
MYQIWDKSSPINNQTREQWFADPKYAWMQNRAVILDTIAGETTEISPLVVVLKNHNIDVLPDDTNEIILSKLNAKILEEKAAESARIAAEEQAKVDAQRDQYLRDCNAELATLVQMPDVIPLDEPVIEDTRFKNYKWNYDNGYWNKTALRLTVQKGMISKQEYQVITGETY